MEKVAYLGPCGSYSEAAAENFRPNAERIACGSFALAMQKVLTGECDFLALPVENSANGSIYKNLDLLQESEVIAFECTRVKIEHALVALKGAEKCGISRIYSHQQALEQCANYLFCNFKNAELIAVPSTSASLKKLETLSDACIASRRAADNNLILLDENISDERDNFTEFLLIKRGKADKNYRSEKVLFSATCPHSAGGLFKLLKPLQDAEINMTKLNSRPAKGRSGEYRFFVEIAADYSKKSVQTALEGVKNLSSDFKILGTY